MFTKYTFTALVCAVAVLAQTQTATVRGVIKDKSGAVIPGAAITLLRTDQNRAWRSTSNAEGEYLFVQVPASNYSLTVEANGFKKHQQSGITLEVAQLAALAVSLEIGAATETIEVTSQAPLLDTASSTLDAVVNNKTTEALPLNGRVWYPVGDGPFPLVLIVLPRRHAVVR